MTIVNRGVIIGQRETDYIAGKVGASLPYEVRNPSGDWRSYLPLGEWQGNNITDTMSCVSFSALNSIEVQEKFLIGKQKDYSDRFTAVMSGTTRQGNWLWKVADSIRKDGLVVEEDYPAPTNYDWDTYHTMPAIEVINKGKLWLNNWSVGYEFVSSTKESMLYHLKHAPLQIIINNDTHAVLEFLCEDDVHNYFDSYEPFIKQISILTSPLKIVLTNKNMLTREEIINQYILTRRYFPSEEEINYWVGKNLLDMQRVMMIDDENLLKEERQ